jgi:hypothetical protein
MSATAAVNTSLYIPHIFANFDKEFVANVFEKLKIGKVKNVDFVLKTNGQGKEYNAAYIHFDYWHDTVAARNFHTKVVNPNEEARIVYDEPWFWVVLENKARKYVPGERKPRIQLDEPAPKKSNVYIPEEEPITTMEVVEDSKDEDEMDVEVDDTSSVVSMEMNQEEEEESAEKMQLEEDNNMEWIQQVIEENQMNEIEAEIEEDERNLDEIADAIEEEENRLMEVEAMIENDEQNDDQNMIFIDGRYVQTLEQENATIGQEIIALRMQLQQYADMYNKEVIKTQALVEVIQTIKKA